MFVRGGYDTILPLALPSDVTIFMRLLFVYPYITSAFESGYVEMLQSDMRSETKLIRYHRHPFWSYYAVTGFHARVSYAVPWYCLCYVNIV